MPGESIQIVGHFLMQLRCARTGEVLQEARENNIVVDQGRTNMLRLLAGDAAGTRAARIGVGTGNTPAEPSNTSLTNAFIKTLQPGITYGANSVTFEYEIAANEANGMGIWEFGLLNVANKLLTRKVLTSVISKNSSFAITGTYTLQVN